VKRAETARLTRQSPERTWNSIGKGKSKMKDLGGAGEGGVKRGGNKLNDYLRKNWTKFSCRRCGRKEGRGKRKWSG